MKLTRDESDLLRWLAQRDYSQYGECHGRALDVLIGAGLVKVWPPREHQEGFIARGDGMMYRAVSLTEMGKSEAAMRKSDPNNDGDTE